MVSRYPATILAVRKVDHFNIKAKMLYFEAGVLIDWLSSVFANQPTRIRASKVKNFCFYVKVAGGLPLLRRVYILFTKRFIIFLKCFIICE